MQLLGVYDDYLVEPLAQVLTDLGVKRGMVVYGQDKLDEISMSAPTTVCEIREGWIRNYVITPEDFGFERCTKADLLGGTPEENAAITVSILKGERGHRRNAVLMNAGASLYIGGKAEDHGRRREAGGRADRFRKSSGDIEEAYRSQQPAGTIVRGERSG